MPTQLELVLAKADIRVIIPAFNEENAVGLVIDEIPEGLVSEVIVVDNGSTDRTREKAAERGATVLFQKEKGYGSACLKGMEHLALSETQPDVVVFLDGDHSDYPEKMTELVQPILDEKAEMVIGSRALGSKESGSMTIPQVFGNWLATRLLKLFYGVKYTDLGPFRAISYETLMKLNMQDRTFGWTVEMQLKIAKLSLRFIEVPVDYRKRVGVSKISGTIKGTLMAGYKILYTIFKHI